MPFFDTKGLTARVLDTIDVIRQEDDRVATKAVEWCEQAHMYEVIRISSKMHLGKSFLSNKTQRKYKRAIILIRAAIMREDLSNVMTSVNNIQNSQLEVQFKRTVRKCRSFEKLIPPLIQQLEAENYRFIQNDAKKAMMEIQHKDAQKKVQVKTCEIYSPFYSANNKDSALFNCLYEIRNKLLPPRSQSQSILSHTGKLDRLDDGGNLYIVGHGNLGKGIGTHHDFLDETQLTQALITSNLTRDPTTPINIYLFACWTATSVKKTYKRGKTEPFAKRFASKLANAGYNNIRIIGFAGSVNKLQLQQEIIFSNGDQLGPKENLGIKDKFCIYEIDNRNYKRTYGVDWTTDSEWNRRRERTRIIVRPRGGNDSLNL